MEKVIKLWKEECLPRGPKSPQSFPPPFALGEGHKLCCPDPDEMKATWIPAHPSLATQILRITGPDGKFQFLSQGHEASTRGPPRNQVQAGTPLSLDGEKFTSPRHSSVLPLLSKL